MSRTFRAASLLCLFGGITLIVVFLNLRPDAPEPIPYRETNVSFLTEGNACPDGLDIDPGTGDVLSCTSIDGGGSDTDTAPAETLNGAEIDQIEALAHRLVAERGSLDKQAQSSVVALAKRLDARHRAAYERSGGRTTSPKRQAPSPLLWVGGLVLIAVAVGVGYLPARSRRT